MDYTGVLKKLFVVSEENKAEVEWAQKNQVDDKAVNPKTALYTQLLTAKRIKENDVVYIFDEVGCGKTVSSIIAAAQVIEEKEKQGECANILICTPLSVCGQFYREIYTTLLDTKNYQKNQFTISICRYDSAGKNSSFSLTARNDDNKKGKHVICIVNPQSVRDLLTRKEKGQQELIPWDLLVIDEAHMIMCNSQTQNKMPYYHLAMRDKNMLEGYKAVQKHAESMSYFERDKRYGANEKSIQLRTVANDVLRTFVTYAKAEKIMFLTATPFHYKPEFDVLNYAYTAYKTLNRDNASATLDQLEDYLPQLEWVEKYYSIDASMSKDEIQSAIDSMEKANTSLSFKEITNSLPWKQEKENTLSYVKRQISIWDLNQTKDIIMEKLGEKSAEGLPNRFILFVSTEKEGTKLAKDLFGETLIHHECTIEKVNASGASYKAKCMFVMGDYSNRSLLDTFKVDDGTKEIPDVLIITYQIAEMGINLPTFNYVVNYHISASPGRLEQRFGRVDRLGTEYKVIHNAFISETENCYMANLSNALYRYSKQIAEKKEYSIICPIPVKNLFFCKELIDKMATNSVEMRRGYYHRLARLIARKLYRDGRSTSKQQVEVEQCISEIPGCILNLSKDTRITLSFKIEGEEYQTEPYQYDSSDFAKKSIGTECLLESQEQDETDENFDSIIESLKSSNRMEELRQTADEEFAKPGTIIYYTKDARKTVELQQFIESIRSFVGK